MADSYDLIVIGSGPAGEKAAAQAAFFGKRVALVEKAQNLGGAGLNTGTVPSKTLRETALYFSGLRQRGLYGIDYSLKKDLTVPEFMHRVGEVTKTLRSAVAKSLERHAIELVRGNAAFADPHTIVVTRTGSSERRLTAPFIVVATGSWPNWPERTPYDKRLYDSDSILQMDRLPKSLAVIGGGVIGCEYATLFRALGLEVTLIGGQGRLLPFLDQELGDRWRMQVELLGVRTIVGQSVEEIRLDRPEVILRLKSGEEVASERVLYATGRMGATQALGLEEIGLEAGPRGHLKVNEHYQTALPHVYAVGDVVGFPALASTGKEQARVAVCHAFDLKYKTRVSTLLPMAVYTIPELAAVGETEESCKEKGLDYEVGRASYDCNSRGQIIGDFAGFVKLVFAREDRRLLGVHILGELASELIHVGQSCLHFGGTLDDVVDFVFNTPTLGEAYKHAAYDGFANLGKRK